MRLAEIMREREQPWETPCPLRRKRLRRLRKLSEWSVGARGRPRRYWYRRMSILSDMTQRKQASLR